MSAERLAFFDTNVLVYAHDTREPRRRAQARDLIELTLERGLARLSTQVLQEFFWAMTRRIAEPLPPSRVIGLVEDFANWPVFTVDTAAIIDAARLGDQAQLAFWDALIVVAAAGSGAEVLYSEDLNHGQTIAGVEVINPFR
jgi:predicted nucleic acid-binding protein